MYYIFCFYQSTDAFSDIVVQALWLVLDVVEEEELHHGRHQTHLRLPHQQSSLFSQLYQRSCTKKERGEEKKNGAFFRKATAKQ